MNIQMFLNDFFTFNRNGNIVCFLFFNLTSILMIYFKKTTLIILNKAIQP